VPTYKFQLTDDLTVPIQANSVQEAEAILKTEIMKREASPIFDKQYFDYETGINVPGLRALLARQETKEEKENVLRSASGVGDDGFNYTTKGDLAITPEGQQILIDRGLLDWEKPMQKSVVIEENKFGSAGDYADFAGAIGPIFGAIAALTPQGRVIKGLSSFFKTPMLRNAIASGLGAAGGKGAEEALDEFQGFREKDAGQTADLLKFEFGVGFAGQGLGEFVGKAFGAVLGRKAPTETIRDIWIQSNRYSLDDVLKLDDSLGRQATEKEIAKASKEGLNGMKVERYAVGAVPSQNAMARAIPGRMQAAGETIFGKKGREASIINYNLSELNKLKRLVADKRAKLNSLSKFDGADSKTIAEVKAKNIELKQADEAITKQIDEIMIDLAEESGGFSNASLMGKEALGDNIQQTVANAYKTMQDDFKVTYDDIFKKIKDIDPEFRIETDDIVRYIDEVIEDNAGIFEVDGPVGKLILNIRNQLEERGGLSLTQLINIRSQLKGKTLVLGMSGGKFKNNVPNSVMDLLDEKIKNLPDKLLTSARRIKDGKLTGKSLTQKQIKDLKTIKTRLSEANLSYYQRHKPFDKALTQKIMNSERVAPDDIYKLIFQKDVDVGDMKRLVQAIPADERGPILYSFLRKYIRETAQDSIQDPLTGRLNPAVFANKILKNKERLAPLLGNRSTEFFRTIEDFVKLKPSLTADELSVLAGQISGKVKNIESMSPDGVGVGVMKFLDAIKAKAANSAQQESMKATNMFARIETASPEEIAKIVFRPKSSADILRVKELVSDDAFIEIQEQALEQILKDTVQTGTTKLNDVFKPGNLERALKMYDTETLEAMFGKDVTQGLKNYTRLLRSNVSADSGGGAGTLIAGALAINAFNVALWPTIAAMGFYKALFSNPRIVSLLAKTDKSSIAEVFRFTERFARLSGVREISLQTSKGIEQTKAQVRSGLDEARQTETGQETEGAFDDILSTISNISDSASQQFKQRNLNTSVDLPKVQPVNPPPSATISQSLIGNNPANMDIARKRLV
jgi:hypothetical protein